MANRKFIPIEALDAKFWKRFDTKVCRIGECLEWTACLSCGYGAIALPGPLRGYARAHQLAWIRANGPIPPDLCVLHACDNRKCVDVSHLYLGTVADNNADCRRRGRRVCIGFLGECNPMAKLNARDIPHIRMLDRLNMLHVDIAEIYGVSRQAVDFAVNGGTWGMVSVDFV